MPIKSPPQNYYTDLNTKELHKHQILQKYNVTFVCGRI